MAVTETDAQRHVTMINTPEEWPRWPVLPMKNPNHYNSGFPDHGIILAIDRVYNGKAGVCVFHTNMFSIPTKTVKNSANDGTHQVIDIEALLSGSHKAYRDAEAVVDAGWVVD